MSSSKTVTQTKTQRVQSLELKDGHQLSSLEESVLRMHHGISVRPEAKLPTNGFSDETMAQLLEREVAAFVGSGRADGLEDIPADASGTSPRQKIIDSLKSNNT